MSDRNTILFLVYVSTYSGNFIYQRVLVWAAPDLGEVKCTHRLKVT